MNIFVRELVRDQVEAEPDQTSTKLVVEDNVGEGIHVHWRNIRLEMSIEDYQHFHNNMASALKKIEDGNY